MTLEQIKELREARAIHEPFKGQHIPVGATIVDEEGENKAMIVGVSDGMVCLSCGVLGDANVKKISMKDLLANWLFETPNGLVICGLPPKKEEEIILPSDIKRDFEIVK